MLHYIQRTAFDKVFGEEAKYSNHFNSTRALIGEEIHFQIVIWSDNERPETVHIKDCSCLFTRLYLVKNVPVNFPCYSDDPDTNYLTDKPTTLPDCLMPILPLDTITIGRNPTVIWVTAFCSRPMEYNVSFEFTTETETIVTNFSLTIIDHVLPKKNVTLRAAISLHSIAEYGKFPVYCNAFWDQLSEHFKFAHRYGIYDIITPLFSSQESRFIDRSPDQLVKISVINNKYEYNYDQLDSWILIAKQRDINNFTFTPFFPSLEHKRCPLVYAERFGKPHLLFSDEDDIFSERYIKFLCDFLKKLNVHLEEMGLANKVTYQITEEISENTVELYSQCFETVRKALRGQNVTFTLRDASLFNLEVIPPPVVPLCNIEAFSGMPRGPYVSFDINISQGMANQLIAAPSVRLRSLGLLYYLYEFSGVMLYHYNCNISPTTNKYFNPFISADGEGSVPSGSTFMIYNESRGPWPSIRLLTLRSAIQDATVLKILQRFVDRDKIIKMIQKDVPTAFDRYPISEESYQKFRDKVYDLLERYIKQQ